VSLQRVLFLALVLVSLCSGRALAVESDGDITPPLLVSVMAPSWQIDTSQAAQTITLTLHITDDLSGFQIVQINYVHVDGYNATRVCFASTDLDISTDVTIECPVSFPRYSAEGRWLAEAVYLTDRVGNQSGRHALQCDGDVNPATGRCNHYQYNAQATDLIRSMEIQVGEAEPAENFPLYLPLVVQP
jgi:hypothetical protein